MKRSYPLVVGIVFLSMMVVAGLTGPAQADDFNIEIQVAPNVLNLQSKNIWVTVHTDILYDAVAEDTVYLNGVLIKWSKADDCGYFVAKFDSNDIKSLDELVIGEFNELILSGQTIDGNQFWGSQEVLIINVPSGKGK